MHINTSLLREKFVIKEKTAGTSKLAAQELCACSNRIVLDMKNKGLDKETFVVRTDSMHLCSRMAGHILANYETRGPFATRLKYLRWGVMWNNVLSDYERRYNKSRWVAVYHKGKLVFEDGKHHAFSTSLSNLKTSRITPTVIHSLKPRKRSRIWAKK